VFIPQAPFTQPRIFCSSKRAVSHSFISFRKLHSIHSFLPPHLLFPKKTALTQKSRQPFRWTEHSREQGDLQFCEYIGRKFVDKFTILRQIQQILSRIILKISENLKYLCNFVSNDSVAIFDSVQRTFSKQNI
jgi:hypothetical protein